MEVMSIDMYFRVSNLRSLHTAAVMRAPDVFALRTAKSRTQPDNVGFADSMEFTNPGGEPWLLAMSSLCRSSGQCVSIKQLSCEATSPDKFDSKMQCMKLALFLLLIEDQF